MNKKESVTNSGQSEFEDSFIYLYNKLKKSLRLNKRSMQSSQTLLIIEALQTRTIT